jgi:hypothetical protein
MKLFHPRLKNIDVTVPNGTIHIDKNGCVEIPEEDAELAEMLKSIGYYDHDALKNVSTGQVKYVDGKPMKVQGDGSLVPYKRDADTKPEEGEKKPEDKKPEPTKGEQKPQGDKNQGGGKK